jgi:hypothetical protein
MTFRLDITSPILEDILTSTHMAEGIYHLLWNPIIGIIGVR